MTELIEDGASQREAAQVLGVDVSTVNRDVANATPDSAETPESEALDGANVANATPDPEAERRAAEIEHRIAVIRIAVLTVACRPQADKITE